MSEIYKDKEWTLRGAIENLSSIPDHFEMYVDEVNKYIDALTNSSIKESRELYLLTQRYEATQKEIKKIIYEIEHNPRTNAETRDKYIVGKLNNLLDKVGSDKE